ncbi:Hypothetical_protein [Hexamita inflata]|uniref:Hypothetical_protein n=1 Tax=Hexamita inflata TaxID=28002 RepID=A0AA86R4J4_9EUKA|nr:Hypothetical protein HINF_LOCUS53364 [Hexamita inflata]
MYLVCIQYVFKWFGLAGYIEGNISIQQLSVVFAVLGGQFYNFGVIGQTALTQLYYTSTSAELINVTATISNFVLNSSSFGNVGSLIGFNYAKWCLIQHAAVNGSNISSSSHIGGIAGRQYGYISNSLPNCILLVQNVTVQNSNFTATNQNIGGFFGYVINTQISISTSSVNSIKIYGTQFFGIFNGIKQSAIQSIDTSFSTGQNYINDVLQTNCPNYQSTASISGC